jgi:hypothetical protein
VSPRLTCTHCGAPIDAQPAELAAHLAWRLAAPTTNGLPSRPDVESLVLDALATKPLSANELQQDVRRRRSDVRAALRSLERQGLMRRTEDDRWRLTGAEENGATT